MPFPLKQFFCCPPALPKRGSKKLYTSFNSKDFFKIIFLTLVFWIPLPPLLSHCEMQRNIHQWTCLYIKNFVNSALSHLVTIVRAQTVSLDCSILSGPCFAECQVLSASTETHLPAYWTYLRSLCQLSLPTKTSNPISITTLRNGTF